MAKYDNATRLRGGVAQFTTIVAGAAAGDVTVAVAEAGDHIVHVESVTLSGTIVTATADLTTEFTTPIAADNTLNNTGGTSSASKLLVVTLAKGIDNTD